MQDRIFPASPVKRGRQQERPVLGRDRISQGQQRRSAKSRKPPGRYSLPASASLPGRLRTDRQLPAKTSRRLSLGIDQQFGSTAARVGEEPQVPTQNGTADGRTEQSYAVRPSLSRFRWRAGTTTCHRRRTRLRRSPSGRRPRQKTPRPTRCRPAGRCGQAASAALPALQSRRR